jgi:hypothetical protein
MPPNPSKVASRLTTQLKRFQGILASAKSRDVNELDTGILVTDLLADLLTLNPRTAADLNLLYLLCREGIVKSLLPEYYLHRQATSRFALGAIVLSEPMLEVVRRELRRLNPGVRVDLEEIKTVLMQEVIKREVMEGEAAEDARRRVRRSLGRALRSRQPRGVDEETESLTPVSQEGEGSDIASGDEQSSG